MISRLLAQAVDAADREVSSVSVTAPLVGGAPILSIVWAGMDDCAVDTIGGVRMTAMCRPPDHVEQLPAMLGLEAHVIEAAWQWGAWDLARTCIGAGYAGALPPCMAGIEAAAREAGYAVWTWRPMLRGPEIRIRAHRAADVTLCPHTLGRSSGAPDACLPPIRPGRQHVLRLGRSPEAERTHRPARSRGAPPATARQRRAICALRREAGEPDHEALPPGLGIREASAWITRLLRERTNRKDA